MKSKLTLQVLSLFLFTLLLVKVSAIHVYCHQDAPTDAIENCKLCEAAIENQQAEYSTLESYSEVSATPLFFEGEQPAPYYVAHTSSILRYRLFGRPPPAIG